MNPAAEMLLAVGGQRSHGHFIGDLFAGQQCPGALRQADRARPSIQQTVLTSVSGQTLAVDYAVAVISHWRNPIAA
jgi:two-component system nitrogen regulation sensor histidine kinase GlnL